MSDGDRIDVIHIEAHSVQREHILKISDCEDYFAQPAWSSGGIVRVAPAAASEQDKDPLLPSGPAFQ